MCGINVKTRKGEHDINLLLLECIRLYQRFRGTRALTLIFRESAKTRELSFELKYTIFFFDHFQPYPVIFTPISGWLTPIKFIHQITKKLFFITYCEETFPITFFLSLYSSI